ncbi:double-stranded DNA-binding protein [Candidatus Nitrosocosmicus franklandus]|nr:double-stranded DNA-binding protein [Candidatus Nitrosocosmicus franklandus]
MDDPDLELIKARKMKKLQEQLAFRERQEQEKAKIRDKNNLELQNQINKQKSDELDSERKFLLHHMYDRGDEVLKLAEQQFPFQTKMIIKRLNELIRFGEISRISGGDLLSVYRSLGMKIRVDTHISISDHGKTISFSDKLRESTSSEQDAE